MVPTYLFSANGQQGISVRALTLWEREHSPFLKWQKILWVAAKEFSFFSLIFPSSLPSHVSMDATHLAGFVFWVPGTGKKGEWKPAPEMSNLLLFVQETNAFLHKSFFFLFKLINPWWLCRVTWTLAGLGRKKLHKWIFSQHSTRVADRVPRNPSGGRQAFNLIDEIISKSRRFGTSKAFFPTQGIPDEGRLLFVPNSQAQVVRKLTPL